mmetsp:Transcript_37790/g.70506  ORF Transcript_37790/g.70506 Transcript_37790/m.70506 type:complete len:204 (-) Transcript_37790:54-665(-)
MGALRLIGVLVAVASAAEDGYWEEEASSAEDVPELLQLLQVEYRLTHAQVPGKAQGAGHVASEEQTDDAISFLQELQEVTPINSPLASKADVLRAEQRTLKHFSVAAALLLSRSTARLAAMTGHTPDLIGEIVLTSIALVVWIFLMMLCSWLGFGGTNRLEEQREMDRQEKYLPPEKHDPIDAAAAQMREAQAQARKEKSACC